MASTLVRVLAGDLAATLRMPAIRLGGALLLLFALVAAALFGTEGRAGLRSWLFFGHVVLPGLAAPLAAWLIANPRRTRLVESLFTAPVRRWHHFVAALLVSLVVAGAYILLLAPVALANAMTSGLPPDYWGYVGAAAAIATCAASIGLAAGALMPGASGGTAAGAASAVLLAGAIAVPVAGTLAALEDPTGGQLGLLRLLHLSPQVLALEASSLPFSEVASESRAPSALALAGLTVGLAIVAGVAYLGLQDVMGWRRGMGARSALVAGLLAIVAAPAAASTTYAAAPLWTIEPVMGERAHVTVTEPRAALTASSFLPHMGVAHLPLRIGDPARLDLVVLFDVPDDVPVTDVRVRLQAADGPAATPASWTLAQVEPGERGVLPRFPPVEGAQAVGRVARVPVVLEADQARAWRNDVQAVRVDVAFMAGGERHDERLELLLVIDDPAAQAKLLAFGSGGPAGLAAAWTWRRVRTGGAA